MSKKEKEKIEFADEKAKIAWEVGEAIKHIWSELPPENPYMKFYHIRFAAEDKTKGTYAILFSGTVVGTGDYGVFVVSERTIEILKQLNISYILEDK